MKGQYRSAIKRFFIQGQVNWQWITIDQILFHGIDEFSNCLNHEFKSLEYSVSFHNQRIAGSHYYQKDSGAVELWSEEDEKTAYNEFSKFYNELKNKTTSEYSYEDVLKLELLREKYNKKMFKYSSKKNYFHSLEADINNLGKITIMNLIDIFGWISRRGKAETLEESLRYLAKKQSYQQELPYEFPINFELKISDVFEDQHLIQEYLETYNEPENNVRESLGLPRIGEGWISETNLYYEIKSRFKKDLVIHHGKPDWLGRQHLDIYMPHYNIGVEYQGDQHYFPVEFFGGEKAFRKSKKRDERKKELCQINDCHLIYVNPGYSIEDVCRQIEEIKRMF